MFQTMAPFCFFLIVYYSKQIHTIYCFVIIHSIALIRIRRRNLSCAEFRQSSLSCSQSFRIQSSRCGLENCSSDRLFQFISSQMKFQMQISHECLPQRLTRRFSQKKNLIIIFYFASFLYEKLIPSLILTNPVFDPTIRSAIARRPSNDNLR